MNKIRVLVTNPPWPGPCYVPKKPHLNCGISRKQKDHQKRSVDNEKDLLLLNHWLSKMIFHSSRIRRFSYEHFSQLRQIKRFYDLKKSQWLTQPMLQRIQEKKLRNVINHAYNHVPYYHHLLKSLSLNPSDIQKVDNLCKIPILTKSEIQNGLESITANNLDRNRCFSRRTSGSTGVPLTIIYDSNSYISRASRRLRSYLECGLKLRDKIYQFSDPRHFHGNRYWFNYLGFSRRRYFSIFDRIDNHITELKKHPPDAIEGYPSVLLSIAEMIRDREIEGINPRLTFSSAELLTEGIRRKINSVLNTELYDRYGSVEFGNFAWECQNHDGYHLDSEDVVVEFLKNGETVSPGEKGEIVVTGLFNYAMPLVRYSLGDIGTLSNEGCSCGRGLPLMKVIDGRTDDFLVLPSGIKISPRNIGTLEYIDGMARFRIIQEKKDKIIVQIVKGRNFSRKTINQIKEKVLRGCLGENVRIVVKLVEEIPKDKSGKIRMIMSKVKA